MPWESEFAPIVIGNFGGGINKELPANEIADDELIDAVNVFFDEDSNLMVRPGTTIHNGTPSAFSNRVPSLFHAVFASGVGYIIATSGSEIYYESSNGVFSSIKGAASLPSDVFWSFAMLDNKLVGANSTATGSGHLNPVKWTGSGNIAQLADGGGNAPRMKYVTVWNNRLFGVSADEPNVVHFSKLGDPENYTVGGGSIEVGADDGDYITAIAPHKGRLFIFKRKRIYQVIAGTPNTDEEQWSIDVYSDNIGCVSFATVRETLDDLLFLSDNGLFSLQIAQETGGFQTFALSRKIPDLTNLTVTTSNLLASFVLPKYNLYGIAIPTSASPSDNAVVWLLDFKRIAERRPRWLRANGLLVGSSYALVNKSGLDQLYIGGTNAAKNIYRFADEDEFSDNDTTYQKYFRTKAYSRAFQGGPEDDQIEKEFNEWGFTLTNRTANTTFTVIARFDEKDTLSASEGFTIAEAESGGQWSISLWDEGAFAVTDGDYPVIRQFQDDPGKYARKVDFTFFASTKDQDWTVRQIFYTARTATRRRVSRI